MGKTIIVPVSGGKDSQVVLSLALAQHRERVVCVHQNTGYDHPATYQQMRDMEDFYGVAIEHTISKYKDMFTLLDRVGYFPNTAARGCTQRLKQEPFAAWLMARGYNSDNSEIWFGMRSDESAARKSKYGELMPEDEFTLGDVSPFYSGGKHKRLGRISCKLPIVTWTTAEVFAYINKEGAPLNHLYSTGHVRVGCYPCLLARKAEWIAAAHDPVGREHILKLIEREDRWAKDGNHRKFIKVHRAWDVRKFLCNAAQDLPEAGAECGYCSI